MLLPLFCLLGNLFVRCSLPPDHRNHKAHRVATSEHHVLPTVLSGKINIVSANQITLTAGKSVTPVTVNAKTRWWIARAPSQPTAFRQSQPVVVHVRHLRRSSYPVALDIADEKSWRWLVIVRKKVMKVTIQTVGASSITTVATPTMPSITYGITAHTTWATGGTIVLSDPFAAGSTIWVLPRYSPSLGVVLRAAADTPHMLLLLKERQAAIVHAKITSVASMPQSIELATVAGDKRILNCASGLVVLRGKQREDWHILAVGMPITVRLHRDDLGNRVVWKVIVGSRDRHKR